MTNSSNTKDIQGRTPQDQASPTALPNQADNLCDNCEQPLQAISPAQSEYVSGKTLRIPFTDICLTIYHDKPTVQYDCPDCVRDRQDDRLRDIYDSGWDDAVDKLEAPTWLQ